MHEYLNNQSDVKDEELKQVNGGNGKETTKLGDFPINRR